MQDEKLDERLGEYQGEKFEEKMEARLEARLEAATDVRMKSYYSDHEMRQVGWDRRVQRKFDEEVVQKVDQYLGSVMGQPSFVESLETRFEKFKAKLFKAKLVVGNDKPA